MKSSIHIYQNDQQIGPYTEEEIRTRVQLGAISTTSLAWQEGMTDWQPLGSFPFFQTPRSVPLAIPPQIPNGSKTTQPNEFATSHAVQKRSFFTERIGRVGFLLYNAGFNFAILLIIGLLGWLIELLSLPEEISAAVGILAILLSILSYSITCIKRLHDLDCSGWLLPLCFIPLAPLFLMILSGTKGSNLFGMSPDERKEHEKEEAKRYLERIGYRKSSVR